MNARTKLVQSLTRAADPLPRSLTDISAATLQERVQTIMARVDSDVFPGKESRSTADGDAIEIFPGPPSGLARYRRSVPWLVAAAIVVSALGSGTAVLLSRSQGPGQPAAPNTAPLSSAPRTPPSDTQSSMLDSRAAQAAVMQCEAASTSALDGMIKTYQAAPGATASRNSAALAALNDRRLPKPQDLAIAAIWASHRAELLSHGWEVVAADLARLCESR